MSFEVELRDRVGAEVELRAEGSVESVVREVGALGGGGRALFNARRLPRTCSPGNCWPGVLGVVGRPRLRASGDPFSLRGPDRGWFETPAR